MLGVRLRSGGHADLDELPRLRGRQTAQNEAVEQCENGGVCADAEGERENGGEREDRIFAEGTEAQGYVTVNVVKRVEV